MNIQDFEAQLAADHFEPAVVIDRAAGYAMGEHEHPFDACALITAGDITLIVDGISSQYRVGDVFRLPAGTPHLEAAGTQGVSYLSGRRPGNFGKAGRPGTPDASGGSATQGGR